MTSVRLITTGALSRFADLVQVKRNHLYRLWLVSPWIGEDEEGDCVLDRIADVLPLRRPTVIVVTRKPELEWHATALSKLGAMRNCQVYTCPMLHTKLYIAECDGFRAALLGSPNFTAGGNTRNKELSVEFRAALGGRHSDVEQLLSDLLVYASELRSLPGVKIIAKGK